MFLVQVKDFLRNFLFLISLIFLSSMAFADTVVVIENGRPVVKTVNYWRGKQVLSTNFAKTNELRYQLEKNAFRGAGTINAPVVSGKTGAMSVGTVTATITDSRGKREVMGQVYEKAKQGGRALGKGAAKLGSFAIRQSPWGRAFNLALGALALSKYFWSDEKGDFVKQNDEKTYFVVKTNEANSDPSQPMTKSQLDDWCAGTVELSADYDGTKHGKVKRFCTDVSIERELNPKSLLAKCGFENPSFNAHRACVSRGYLTGFAVRVIRVADNYVPITLDEFIDEATPEADSNPNDWVETSGVQPTDEPKVEVPAGTVAQTNPYTDPKDGKTKQTRWDFEPNGKVRETEIPRPDLTPDSPEAPRLDPPKQDDGTDTGDKDKPKDDDTDKDDKDKKQQEQPDLCETNPDILACQKMGDVENEWLF